ncbi:MAG: hypothetical protein QXT53_02765 [Ignisphaera sp.]
MYHRKYRDATMFIIMLLGGIVGGIVVNTILQESVQRLLVFIGGWAIGVVIAWSIFRKKKVFSTP